MIISLKITQEDQEQAARLLAWIDKLGGVNSRGGLLLLCVEAEATAPEVPSAVVIRYTDAFHHFPESNNIAFQEIANYCKDILKAPFIYMEANAVPLVPEWFDKIQAAYLQAVKLRKPFMGDVIKLTGHPDSFAPVGVYPPNITDFAGEMMTAHDEEPWTIAAAGQMGNWTIKTPLIRHAWDGATLDALGSECVLVHPDRTGSFLETLCPASVRDQTPAQATREDVGSLSVGAVSDLLNSLPPPETQPIEPIVDEEGCFVHGLGNVIREPRAYSENLETTQTPWESKPHSIEEIKRLCARLKEFQSCPAYTSLVRKELKIAKVVR